MKMYLSKEEFEKVEQLAHYAIQARNKKEAESYIHQLQGLGYGLMGRANNIFGELICYVINAAGGVSDKERKVGFVKERLYTLSFYGVKDGI